jgi:dihydrofolate reductase
MMDHSNNVYRVIYFQQGAAKDSRMNLIVACDLDWHIGYMGQLLFRISDDLKRFRALTTGHPVILGRKTLETFPNGRPLPQRENLILSRNPGFYCYGATVVHNLSQLATELERIGDPDSFVIGGADIYRQLLPYCSKAYVTRITTSLMADCSLENLDENKDWHLTEKSALLTSGYLSYYCLYENLKVRQFS